MSSDTPKPRRRYPRYAVDSVPGRLRRPLPARLVNWGVDGVDLETHHRLTPGQTLYFRFREAPDEWVVIDGEVVWCRPASDSLFRAGIGLRASSPRMARELLTAFRALAPGSWELDATGRYRSAVPVLLMYELEMDVKVRSLSCGGMLAEADGFLDGAVPDVDSRVELEISLPDRLLRSKARVAYQDGTPPANGAGESVNRLDDTGHSLGVAFVELRREDRQGLQTFLSALSPTSNEDERG